MAKKKANAVHVITNPFTPEQMEWIRNNLTIDTDNESGYYGETTVNIRVSLAGEEIGSGSGYVSGSYNWNSSDC